MGKVSKLCTELSQLEDVRADLALLRVSANASKIAHLLRAAGPRMPKDVLCGFDKMQKEVLGDTLDTRLSDRMWRQATTPAAAGGLGMRRTEEMQFALFIASRIEAMGAG